jgi:hypothetical protein
MNELLPGITGAHAEEVRPAVPVSLAAAINEAHRRVEESARAGAEHARQAGELLLQAKAQVEHGAWLPWVKANCQFSERTARAYMRMASNWPVIEANRQRAADLSMREALKLLADLGDEEEASGAPSTPTNVDLPPPLAVYLGEGAIIQEHVRQLLTLQEVYSPELLQRVIGPFELESVLCATQTDNCLTWRRAEEVPSQRAAEALINFCRVEDQPIVWLCCPPFGGDCPAVVLRATETFKADLIQRDFHVPQWEVAAFWWASQLARVTDFTPFPGPTEWLAHHLAQWRERHEHALVWLGMQRTAGVVHAKDMADEEERQMWWGFRSDLRHSSSLGREEQPLGPEGSRVRAMVLRVIRTICESGVIVPTIMQERIRKRITEEPATGREDVEDPCPPAAGPEDV